MEPVCIPPCVFYAVTDSGLCVILQVQVPAERVTGMAISPDGNCLAAVTWVGSIFLYSRRHSRHRLSVLGERDTQASEASEEGPKSQDDIALPAEVPPWSCASIGKAATDEAMSRLPSIDHGSQGTILQHCVLDLYCILYGLPKSVHIPAHMPGAMCCSWEGYVLVQHALQLSGASHAHGSVSAVQAVPCKIVLMAESRAVDVVCDKPSRSHSPVRGRASDQP